MEGLRHFLRWTSWILEYVALVFLGSLGFALDVDTGEGHEERFLKGLVTWSQENATEVGVGLATFVFLTRVVRYWCREKSPESEVVERVIGDALEKFRSAVFGAIPEDVPDDHIRVTLFKHYKLFFMVRPFRGFLIPWGWGRYPWSGWLAVAYRTGHVAQTGGAIFLAPDDAQHSEGVAGMAWRCGKCQVGIASPLPPDLSSVRWRGWATRLWLRAKMRIFGGDVGDVADYVADCAIVEEYAKLTQCSSKFVWQRIRRGRPNPTSIVAVMLRDHNNRPWGVVVMDSCTETRCSETNAQSFRAALTTLKKELIRLDVLR